MCTSREAQLACAGGECVEQWRTFKCICDNGFEADHCRKGTNEYQWFKERGLAIEPVQFTGGSTELTLTVRAQRQLLFRPIDPIAVADFDVVRRKEKGGRRRKRETIEEEEMGQWMELDVLTRSSMGTLLSIDSQRHRSIISV